MKRDGQNDMCRQLSVAEQTIEVDQELLKRAIMDSPYGYVITACRQTDNPIVFVNRGFEKITGYQALEALGRSACFLLGNDRSQEPIIKLSDAKKNNKRCTEVIRNYRKDGSLFYNELSVYPIRNQTGAITHHIWTQCDVTPSVEKERKLSKQIAEKDERFSAYMQNSNEALWRIDFHPPIPLDEPEGKQVQAVFDRGVYGEANDVTAKIYGLKQGKDVRGRPLKEFLPDSDPGNVRRIVDLVQNKFHKEHVITIEERADERSFVALNNIIPVINEGAVSHLWGASLDITELYKTQEDLRISKHELDVQKKALEEKNIALKELITHIEMEKKEFIDRVVINIAEIALPSLERIRLNKGEETYIEQHRKDLESLTSSYGQKINNIRIKLTPREMEVCNLVKNGHVNKEIARLLNIAQHTVEKHRRMARKKLGLANKKVNLHSYLNSL